MKKMTATMKDFCDYFAEKLELGKIVGLSLLFLLASLF